MHLFAGTSIALLLGFYLPDCLAAQAGSGASNYSIKPARIVSPYSHCERLPKFRAHVIKLLCKRW